MVRVAIVGASGYTGAEAIEILLRHPHAKLTYATGSSETGHVGDVFPQFKGRCDIVLEQLDIEKLRSLADVALCCLPHKVSMNTVPKILATGVKVVDLSADYRIKDAALYEKYYSTPHSDRANLAMAVYGLPELFREQIRNAQLIANPGCYPTTVALGLAPLLKNKLIVPNGIVVNSVSGITGAGKAPSTNFHFPNMNENMFAYSVGIHRHMPEMEQTAATLAGEEVELLFQPHVGPFDRGILSSIYCTPKTNITTEELAALYKQFYTGERFVQITKTCPMLKNVAHSNYCHIHAAAVKGRIVVFSAIDNMFKGASGQAIQNMNIMFGLEESAALV